MIFLIEYKRSAGLLVTFRRFDDSQREQAWGERLALELDLHRKGIEHEVVLLEAENEGIIRRTHGRYFQDLRSLLNAAGGV